MGLLFLSLYACPCLSNIGHFQQSRKYNIVAIPFVRSSFWLLIPFNNLSIQTSMLTWTRKVSFFVWYCYVSTLQNSRYSNFQFFQSVKLIRKKGVFHCLAMFLLLPASSAFRKRTESNQYIIFHEVISFSLLFKIVLKH